MEPKTIQSPISRRLLQLTTYLIIFLSAHFSLYAQVNVTGKIISTKDQIPLAGATVRLLGTSKGVITQNDGTFKIQASLNKSLTISIVGFLKKEVKITSADLGVIELQEDAEALNTVVVVGYGSQKKANLTGAISTLDMTEKEGQPITNASNALYGLSGLFINQSNSQPGVDRADILIRGMGTLSNNSPLILVDGIEYSMDELNPNDIATVTILKDASAAIYGSKAAGGVILITTKSGKGKSKVNYSYYTGVQNPTQLPDVIWDPIAYMKLKNQAELNEGKTQVDYSDADLQEYQDSMKSNPFVYPSNNWFDIALQNGTIQKHDLSFSGSGDKYQYRLSLGYLDRTGIMFGPANDEKKYSLGLNSSLQVSKRLKIGLTLDGYYRYYTQPGYNSFWQYLSRALPILTDTLQDGRFGNSWLRTPGRNNWENPRMIAYSGISYKYVQRFLSTAFATYNLPYDINYNIKFGADKYDGLLKTFIPQVQTVNPKTGALTNWNSPTTAPRNANQDYNNLDIHFYNTLDWHHQFAKKHNVALMLGSSYDNYSDGGFNAEMTGYLDASLTALDAGTILEDMGGHYTKDVLESYFGRVNYDYNGKYLFEATFRYDGSSRFALGHRWSFFPSASAGWRIDKESFFKSNFIDLLKLRGSVGQLGNQAVPLYSYENSITLGHNYSFGGPNGVLASGAAATAYSDPNTTWETTTDYDLGLDMNLWDNRINFTADVYKKLTTGILRQVNIPSQIGDLSGPQQNVGTVSNIGYELGAGFKNNIGAFNYSVSGNIAFNKNKVVDLHGQILYNLNTNLSTITQAGYPIDSYYLLDAIGIFQSDEEVKNSPFQAADVKAGYIKYRDVNGDNMINGDDRLIIPTSSVIPKYTYGFNLNVGYKGFALNAFFQGVSGIKVYVADNLAFPFNNGAGATWEWANDSWTPDRTNAKLPIVTESNYGSEENFLPSTFWMKDASYLRLKNIQLSYEFPQKWLAPLKINRISVFVNAQNYLTFTKFKDYDPETALNVISLYHYPMLKTISGGINVTF